MQFRHIAEAARANRATMEWALQSEIRSAAVTQLPPPPRAPRLGRLLLSRGAISRTTLARALRRHRRTGARLGDVLASGGFVTRNVVDTALAEQARLPQVDIDAQPIAGNVGDPLDLDRYLVLGIAPWRRNDGHTTWLTADPMSAHYALALLGASPGALRVYAPRQRFEDALLRRFAHKFAWDAAEHAPLRLSARGGLATWQSIGVWAGLLGAGLAAIVASDAALSAIAMLVVALAGASALLRLIGLFGALAASRPHEDQIAASAPASERLPKISIIIALYRESATMPSLIEALMRLDYPPERLEVIFALEADDQETMSALNMLSLPGWARIICAPQGRPRTKPRALNLALRFAQGDIIGVYDAEDRPERDQLRKVARAFAGAPSKLACVQARLAYYNARESWIARCFSIEYHMWFVVLLKGLADLGAPIPLGGTSMFIRRAALDHVGGWDAHNVTEDADLGMRLARAGYRSGVIDSTTWEEASASPGPWIRQRSRWLKGFMQTWISQTRAPFEMVRRLGFSRAVLAQIILLAPPVMFLLQPLFWATTIYWMTTGEIWMQRVVGPAAAALMALTVTEQATVLAAALLALKRRRAMALAPWVATLPLYWPMGAAAAVKALVELVVAPTYWDKTTHGVGRIATQVRARALARLRTSPS